MTDKCPTPLNLAVYFVEGDQAPSAPAIRSHLDACEACRARIGELEADRKAFLVQNPFTAFWNRLEGHPSRRSSGLARFWRRLSAPAVLRAAAALASVAALMVVVYGRYDRPTAPAPQKILSKGSVGLQFYVAGIQGKEAERGKSGMSLPQGAGLQFLYTAQEPFLLLAGVEADGTLSVYYPSGGAQSGPIEAGDQKKLPQALRWQPKTAYERFYAVFSKEPVSAEAVRKAVEELTSSGKTIEQSEKLPLPYPQVTAIIYRKSS